MPKVISYTPGWLSRPSPGFDLFSPKDPSKAKKSVPKSSNSTGSSAVLPAARRIIARRGTEVFVVVDNVIRWADLPSLKDEWESTKDLDDMNLDGVQYKVSNSSFH